MAIAFDAAASGSDTDGTPDSPLQWTHTPVGTPRAIIVYITAGALLSTLTVSGVTYGGTTMLQLTGSPNEQSGGDNGNISAWFLGASVPTGAQTVSATLSPNSSGQIVGTSLSYTAAANCSIVDVDATIDSATATNPSVTLALGSVDCACSIGIYTGHNEVTSIAPLSGWTSQNETDLGLKCGAAYTYDTVGSADVTAGWTQTSAAGAAIAVAIREGSTYTISAAGGSYAVTGTAAALTLNAGATATSELYYPWRRRNRR